MLRCRRITCSALESHAPQRPSKGAPAHSGRVRSHPAPYVSQQVAFAVCHEVAACSGRVADWFGSAVRVADRFSSAGSVGKAETGVNANGGQPERRVLQDPAKPPLWLTRVSEPLLAAGRPHTLADPGLRDPALQFFVLHCSFCFPADPGLH